MRVKKVLAMLMTATMLVGATSVVSAANTEITEANNGAYSAEASGTSTTEVPIIKVSVPTTVDFHLDPYKLMDGATSQISSEVQYIKSESNVPLNVSMTMQATDVTGITFATAKLKGNETTKSVFAWAEVVEAEETTAAIYKTSGKVNDSGQADDGKDIYELDQDDKFQIDTAAVVAAKGTFTSEYAKATNQILLGTKSVTQKDVYKLPKATTTEEDVITAYDTSNHIATTKTVEKVAPTYLAYKFIGEVSTTNTVAWATSDTATIKIVFSFTPVLD